MIAISPAEAALEILARRRARRGLHDYITYTSKRYKPSLFSAAVCTALDNFMEQVQAGKRPVLALQAPPQHGKSEMVSRRLPPYVLGRFPDWRVATASYSDELANSMGQDVRRIMASQEHRALFPAPPEKRKYDLNRTGEFTAPGGSGIGGYLGVGVGSGLTGRPVDIGIIDDPIKNQEEALSPTTKESIWNWYQSVFATRMSEHSGQIIMATSWAEDDLIGRIAAHFAETGEDERFTHLRFPAINDPQETGYNPELPMGALVPGLHSMEQLKEIKLLQSDYWWSAMYQQSPKKLGGNVFKDAGAQYYYPMDLPEHFDQVINSWDCTFKDTDGTDFVVGQVWGKKGANAYLLDQIRERMSFTKTIESVIALRKKWTATSNILIEDKANGPAVIDILKTTVPGLLPIEPDGSKLARAHAVTAYWEALNVWLPHPDVTRWTKALVNELTHFPAAAHDDQVDSLSQALRFLYPRVGELIISQDAINRAMGLR